MKNSYIIKRRQNIVVHDFLRKKGSPEIFAVKPMQNSVLDLLFGLF